MFPLIWKYFDISICVWVCAKWLELFENRRESKFNDLKRTVYFTWWSFVGWWCRKLKCETWCSCVCVFLFLKIQTQPNNFVGTCVYIMAWLGYILTVSLSYYIVYFLRFTNLTFISILCTSSLAFPNIVISSPLFRMRELCDQCQKQSPESVTCFMPIIKLLVFYIYTFIRGKILLSQ